MSATKDTLEAVRKVVVKHGQEHDAYDDKLKHLDKEVNMFTSRWHDQVIADAKQAVEDKMEIKMKNIDDVLDEQWEGFQAQGMARMRALFDHRAAAIKSSDEELKNQVDSCDEAVKKVDETVKKVEAQMPNMADKEEVKTLKTKLASFGRRVSTLEAAKKDDSAAHAKQILELVTKQDEFSGEVDTMKLNQNALQSAHNDHKQTMKRLEHRVKDLENPLKVRQVTASHLGGYISTAVGEPAQNQGNSDGHGRKEMGALAAKAEIQETRIQELETSTQGHFEEIDGAFRVAGERFVQYDEFFGHIAEKFIECDNSFHTISEKFDEIEAAKEAEVKAIKDSSEQTLRKAKESAALELRQQKEAADKELREYKESAKEEMRLLKASAQNELEDHKACADKEFSEYRAKAEAETKAQNGRIDDLANQVANFAAMVASLLSGQKPGQIAPPQQPPQPPPQPPTTPGPTGHGADPDSSEVNMGGTGENGSGGVGGNFGGKVDSRVDVDTEMKDAEPPVAGPQPPAAEPFQQPTQQKTDPPQDIEMTSGPRPVSSNEAQAQAQGPQQQPQASGGTQPQPDTGPAQPSAPALTLPSPLAGLKSSMWGPEFISTDPSQQPAPVPSTPVAQPRAQPTPQLAPQHPHPEPGPFMKSIFSSGAHGFTVLPATPSTLAPSATPGQGPTAPSVYLPPTVEVPKYNWKSLAAPKVDFAPEAELPGNDDKPPPSKAKPSTAVEFEFNSPRESVQKPDLSSPSPSSSRIPPSEPPKQETDGATPVTAEPKAKNEEPAPANGKLSPATPFPSQAASRERNSANTGSATTAGNTPASNGNAQTAACKNDDSAADKQGNSPSTNAPGSSDINKPGSSSATGSSSPTPATPNEPKPTNAGTPKTAKKKKPVNIFTPKPKGTPGASSPATPRKPPGTPSKPPATPGKSPATQNARELAASVNAQRDAFAAQFSSPQPENNTTGGPSQTPVKDKKEFFIPGLVEGPNTPTGKAPGTLQTPKSVDGSTPSYAKTSGAMEESSKFNMFSAPPGESAAPEHSSSPHKTQGSSGAAQIDVAEPPELAGDSDIQMDGTNDAPETTPADTQPANEDPERFLECPKDPAQRPIAKAKSRAAKLTPAQIEEAKRKTQEEGAALQPPEQNDPTPFHLPKGVGHRPIAKAKGRIDEMPASELAEHKKKTPEEAAWDQAEVEGWPSRKPADDSSEAEDEVDYGDPDDANDEDNHITVMGPPQPAQKPTRYSIGYLKKWRDSIFEPFHIKRIAKYEFGLEGQKDAEKIEEMAELLRKYDDWKSDATLLEDTGLPATQRVFTKQEIGKCFTMYCEHVLFGGLRAYLGDKSDEKNWDDSRTNYSAEIVGYFLYHPADAI